MGVRGGGKWGTGGREVGEKGEGSGGKGEGSGECLPPCPPPLHTINSIPVISERWIYWPELLMSCFSKKPLRV